MIDIDLKLRLLVSQNTYHYIKLEQLILHFCIHL